jgi:hypothetical protein
MTDSTATATTDQLLSELKEAAQRYADATGNKSPDTGVPLFNGISWDVRLVGGRVQIGLLGAEVGWVLAEMPHAEVAKLMDALRVIAESTVSAPKISIQ